MKKKLSVFCSLLLALQMMFSLAVVPVFADEETTSAIYEEPESPAITYNMNVDWKFKKAAVGSEYPLAKATESVAKDGKNFYEADYDDSDWSTVSVPHPINAEDSFDGQCYDAGEAGLYRGFMFYRKHITIPESDAGKKFFLEFEAVRNSVYLYVNGEIVGYYEAGISATGFDITNYVKSGQDNLIAVATDNAADRGQADTTKVTKETKPGSAPGSADGYGYQWNTKDFNEVQGGITGNVKLYAKGKTYQTLPLYNNLKTKGNYIYATDFNIREKSARITVEGEVRNEDADKHVTLEVNVVEMVDPNKDVTDADADHTKKPYIRYTFSSEEKNVKTATDTDADIKTTVPDDAYDENPAPTSTETVDVTKIVASAKCEDMKFWSPDSPNLYDVYTVLKDSDGNVLDVQKTTTGFRKVEYDINDGGLKINEQPVWLTGYAQRSTNEWAVIGVANDWLQDLDMQWIKESNSNFIRWMHVAPKPSQIRSGDKYGVVSACPAGDKESDTDGRTWDQRVEAMRDAMIYFRNSPSVIFWETGNNAVTAEHQQEMTDLKNILDPNGGRFSGCRTISSTDQIQAAEYVGTMLNRHAGNAKKSMAEIKKYVPIMETEYAREEAPRRVWDDFSPPDYDYRNKWLGAGAAKTDGYDVHDLTSEEFSVVDARAYNEFYSDRVGGSTGNDYYSAAAIMVWSDSNMHNRNTASENCRTSGKVDPVRIKKDVFYTMQTIQSTTPKLHIVGHWNYPQLSDDTYNYPLKTYNGKYWEETGEYGKRDPKNKTVYVIGSAGISKVELYVNDKLKGTSTKPDSTFIYSFDNIDVTESGTIKAVAYDAREEVIAEDDISTTGEATTLKITPVVGPDGLIADGSDIAYFDVDVVDSEGNTCPLAYDKINLSLNGEGVLLGGYNSGVGDKITTNNTDYCYAECGTNRIFVRSTRNAGAITLSASLEGQAPITATINSTDDLDMTGGLTTQMQRAFEQGDVVQIVQQTVPSLKTLGSSADADFSEEGNTYTVDPDEDIDKYEMKLNGVAISGYTKSPYRPDTTTGVLCDAIKTLDALKELNPKIEYTIQTEGEVPTYTDGSLPIVSITGGLKEGHTQIDIQNGSTTLFIDKSDKNLLNAQIEYKDGELITDIGAVLGYLDGVSYNMNTNTKVANIICKGKKPSGATPDNDGNTSKAVLEYGNGTARVTAINAIENANLIFASYNTDKTLKSIDTKKVTLDVSGAYNDYNPSSSFVVTDNMKVMLWASDMATPICKSVVIGESEKADTTALFSKEDDGDNALLSLSSIKDSIVDGIVGVFADDSTVGTPQTLDILVASMDGESSTLTSLSGKNGGGNVMVPATIEDGAPDGTKYIKTGAVGNNKYGEYCLESECTYPANTKADVMLAIDVRFDAEGAGFTPEDSGDKKIAGAVVLKNGTIQMQRGSKDYTDTKISVDSTAWYHIALVGRYSAADANVDMYVWKYNSDGTKTFVKTVTGMPLRNLAASNNNGVSHINVLANTSFDNVSLYTLGADTLTLDSSSEKIKAGETMLFSYSATRLEQYITAPAVKWSVYNEANDAVLNDENITISDSGLLTIGAKASKKKITVRATAENGIYASKSIDVDAVDTSTDTYDKLDLSADKTTVRVGENTKITASATLNGEAVTPGDGDLKYVICNEANLRALNNKNITITEEGVLSVTEDALPQTITVRGTNKSGSVQGTVKIQILPANMNTGNEDKYTDTYVSSNSCEEYISGVGLEEGSWDGSGYYNVTAAYDFVGFSSNTSADVIYSADMKFAKDGAGWTVFNSDKGKLGLQLSSSGTTLNAIGASNKTVGSMTIDKDSWYNVQVMCSTGNSNAYAVMMVYKYDENGKRTNPLTGAENTPYILTCALRNLGESPANHINISAGTCVDNVMSFSVAPDKLTLTVDAQTILAGGSAQASTKASRKGVDFPYLNSNLIKYEIYDAENKYPLGSDKITIDASGKIDVDAMAEAQDIYVRVSSTSGGMNDSKKITIKSSDIFEINKFAFEDEDMTKFKRIDVTKNFNYSDEVTFVAATYNNLGALTSIAMKKAYGDNLKIGSNKVTIAMDLPANFDKVNDRFNAFVLTKLSSDEETAVDENMTAVKNETSVNISNIPEFDTGAKVVVLALKADADETDVKSADILYFTQIASAGITDSTLTIPAYEAGMRIKLSGNVNGVHTVVKAVAQ